MAFPVWQNPFDWVTQYWNILLGKKVDADKDAWLTGPVGAIAEDSSRFIERIAKEHGLHVEWNMPGAGLVENPGEWGVPINPRIADFYRRTTEFQLSVQTVWKPIFGHLGYLVARIFSRRIQQLNLPQEALDSSVAIESEIIKLVDSAGNAKFTIWRRNIRDTGEAVFFGIYTSCTLPSEETCMKVIFPLPRGSATVIFRPESDARGNLLLVSSGKKYGDPGFYFLVEDARGALWKHYLPSFRQQILISEGKDGILKAEHTLTLWSIKVYSMIYGIAATSAAARDKSG